MSFSRRTLLHRFAAGAFTAATIPSLESFGPAATNANPMRLDKNENAYGPSLKAAAAIRSAVLEANRFPSAECDELVERIAKYHKVKPEQVTLGAGSREIVRMAMQAFLSVRRKVVLASPTFEAVSEFAQRQGGINLAKVPLNRRSAHDLDAMLTEVDATAGLVYICNPNNPTGSLTPRKDLEVFLQKLPATTAVVIDEAYHDYVGVSSDYTSFVDKPMDDERVIVTRTFSKIYGLAGLRVGYAISSKQRANVLSANRLPLAVSTLAAVAATAALEDHDYVRTCADRNRDDRQQFYNMVNARMQRQVDSLTNFVLMKTGLPAKQVVEHLRKNNILVGPLIREMDMYVRVSMGTAEEMREFWRVWDLLPSHKMAM